MPGRHAAPGQSRFWRDLIIMIAGIIGVAVIVFGGLWLLDGGLGSSDDESTTTSTTEPVTTTVPDTTTSTLATTSSTPAETTTTTVETTTTTQEARPPSEVTVQVLNHLALIEGAAGRLTDTLQEAGYSTVTPSNYEGDPLAVSSIRYDPGFEAEAAALLDFVPDAEVEASPTPDDPGDVVILLGESFEE